MNSLISINNKFMSISPKRLVELILEYKETKGVEIYIDCDNVLESKYLDDLVFELERNNLILQIHGNVEIPYEKQFEYLKKIEKYSDYLKYPIVFTLHSIYDENIDISLEKTIEYISNLINEIDNNKVIFCLENLNSLRGVIRLDKEKIRPFILNDEKLYFTYDIGHELIDHGDITDLDNYMIEDIRNVHIHTNDGIDYDHLPIYKDDTNWNYITKALTYLIINNYKYNIVYEYDLNMCKGETTEEKVRDYLESIDYVSQKYNNI